MLAMKDQPVKRGRGRPPVTNPKAVQLNVRIDGEMRDALEAYRAKNEQDAISDAARDILKKALRAAGLLK